MLQTVTSSIKIDKKRLKVALIGNPNSGKSTLFNILTGLKQKIANFPGVTVDKKTGFCKIVNSSSGKTTSFEIIDLPGTYSLYPKSPDERIPFLTLCDPKDDCHPDIVIIIADSTNLKRSLFLASQVIDLKIPSILALNMSDIVKQNGININESELQERLGMRVVPISARYVKGIEELKQALRETGLEVAARSADFVTRLPIDRAFTMRGFGAVVTGTLIAGSIGEGDELELLPAATRVRVRGVQVHGSPVPRAVAG